MAALEKSLRTAYAQSILNKNLLMEWNEGRFQRQDSLPKAPELPPKFKDEDPYQGRVCIIGAGAAGLYLAMMLKYLGAPSTFWKPMTGSAAGVTPNPFLTILNTRIITTTMISEP